MSENRKIGKLACREINNKMVVELHMDDSTVRPLTVDYFFDIKIDPSVTYDVEFEKQTRKIDGSRIKYLVIYYEGKPIYCDYPTLFGKEVNLDNQNNIFINMVPEKKSNELNNQEKILHEKDLEESKFISNAQVEKLNPRRIAKTPYNFVPLNSDVITIDDPAQFQQDKYSRGTFSGYVELDIEALTPLYIRGTEDNVDKEATQNSDFFSPSGVPAIPGSSIRGAIRTLVEIMSFAKFQFYNKGRLYFRGLADQSNLRRYYSERMTDQSLRGSQKYKIKAGYLKKEGTIFKLIPAKKQNSVQFRRYKGPAYSLKHYEFKKIEVEKNTNEIETHFIIRSGPKVHPRKREQDIWEIFPPDDSNEAKKLELSDEDVKNYREDNNRGAGIDLLIEAEKRKDKQSLDTLVPCFYVVQESENTDIAIGHTALFRITYRNSIRDLVESFEAQKNSDAADLAESLFGRIESKASNEAGDFAGRVFFEETRLIGDTSEYQLPVMHPKILSTPKPTSFQHYLVQNSDDIKRLKHYDDNTTIRGYKLYWHKSGKNWQEDSEAVAKHKTQYTSIAPLKEGAQFLGKIRFENLTEIELGALLCALQLPEGCAHKIGMAKPHGLGSIKITPHLYLTNADERYASISSGWNKAVATDSIDNFIEKFQSFVCQQMGEKTSYWDIPRMRELTAILNVDLGNKLDQNSESRYMTVSGGNEFKDRKVLPAPTFFSRKYNINLEVKKKSSLSEPEDRPEHAQKIKKPEEKLVHAKKLKRIYIDGFFNNKSFQINFNPDITILHGKNGSGKSTVVNLIDCAINHRYYKHELRYPPKSIKLEFNNGGVIEFSDLKQVKNNIRPIQCDLVSTFDSPIGMGDSSDQSFQSALNSFLLQEIRNKLPEFYKLLSEDAAKREQFSQIMNSYFEDTDKRLIYFEKFDFQLSSIDEYNEKEKGKGRNGHPITMDIYNVLRGILVQNKEYDYDEFYGELEKHVHISDDIRKIIDDSDREPNHFRFTYLGNKLDIAKLSAGEKQLLNIFITVLSQNYDEHTILLLDEPEISLHPVWQERLLNDIISLKPNLQIIATTHSASIFWKGLTGKLFDMNIF